MKIQIILYFLLAATLSCNSQNYKELPERFTSHNQAIFFVKRSKFKVEETANTSSSSWIMAAKYYSCDGNTGYFIYSTNKGYEYIHCKVPAYVWEGFKKAKSKGTYYNTNINNKYQLKLNYP